METSRLKPFAFFACIIVAAVGCVRQDSEQVIELKPPVEEEFKEPEVGLITVQHILVNFADSTPKTFSPRSQDEAKKLAEELKKRADGGEDFTGLVEEYTADSAPGIMKVADSGVDINMLPASITSRSRLVKSFGDVSFSLEIGEIGIAEYDEDDSPFGYHVIKRLK